jgi:hypothetical protein
MALAQRTGLRDIGRRRALRAGVRLPTALMARSMLALGRLILGGYAATHLNGSRTTSRTRSCRAARATSTGSSRWWRAPEVREARSSGPFRQVVPSAWGAPMASEFLTGLEGRVRSGERAAAELLAALQGAASRPLRS